MPFTALLIGTFFHFAVATSSNIQAHICRTPTAPTVSEPADGTHTTNPSITVAGTSNAGDIITILDNGNSAATTTSDSAGAYQVDVPLVENNNNLTVRASNLCGDSADGTPFTVVYDKPPTPPTPPPSGGGSTSGTTEPPSTTSPTKTQPGPIHIPILLPQTGQNGPVQTATSGPLILRVHAPDSQTTSLPSIVLWGETNVPATISMYVGDRLVGQVATDANGHFSMRIPLELGKNNVTITATAGKASATIHLGVTRIELSTPKKNFFQRNKPTVIITTIVGLGIIGVIAYAIGIKIRTTKRW